MATIKLYSDLQQSRKLAEILPLESADMYYDRGGLPSLIDKYVTHESIKNDKYHHLIPCWSLASLFGVLPMITKGKDTANPFIAKTPDKEYYVVYATLTKEVDSSAIYDNPIDACYEMIIKLHELNLL